MSMPLEWKAELVDAAEARSEQAEAEVARLTALVERLYEDVDTWRRVAESAERALAAAREALEVYRTDHDNLERGRKWSCSAECVCNCRICQLARAALAANPAQEGGK